MVFLEESDGVCKMTTTQWYSTYSATKSHHLRHAAANFCIKRVLSSTPLCRDAQLGPELASLSFNDIVVLSVTSEPWYMRTPRACRRKIKTFRSIVS